MENLNIHELNISEGFKENTMKKIMSVALVMIMALALVSSVQAGTGSSYNDEVATWAGFVPNHAGLTIRDADIGGDFSGLHERTPDVMGSPSAY
jgi:hypothetical protein